MKLLFRPVGHKSRVISTEGVFEKLRHHGPITLLEIDVPGHEWDILCDVLNSGILVVCRLMPWNAADILFKLKLRGIRYLCDYYVLLEPY